jgi:asparagine synthase (glutamine-hydrolysing)
LFEASVLQQLVEEHGAGVANHGEQLWLLLNLEIWQRIYLDGEDPARILSSP